MSFWKDLNQELGAYVAPALLAFMGVAAYQVQQNTKEAYERIAREGEHLPFQRYRRTSQYVMDPGYISRDTLDTVREKKIRNGWNMTQHHIQDGQGRALVTYGRCPIY